MTYCIYCAERLTRPTKVCPFCKKLLDINMIKRLYGSGESSRISRWVRNRIWFKEHGYILTPLFTLVIGLGIGAFLFVSFLQVRFNSERSAYELKIANLQAAVTQKEANVDDARAEFEKQLADKQKVISVLKDKTETLIRIINLTRHFAENNTIIPVSAEEADYFKRNFRVLNTKFNNQQKKLRDLGYTSTKSYDLKTIPELLAE